MIFLNPNYKAKKQPFLEDTTFKDPLEEYKIDLLIIIYDEVNEISFSYITEFLKGREIIQEGLRNYLFVFFSFSRKPLSLNPMRQLPSTILCSIRKSLVGFLFIGSRSD